MDESVDMVECDDGESRPRSECECTGDGRWFPSDEVVYLADGSCRHPDDDDVVCRSDGKYDWRDDCTSINGEWYSDEDCTTCDSCGDSILREDACSGPGSQDLCSHCEDEYTHRCAECDEVCWSDDMCYDEEDDCSYCASCFAARPRLIRPYSDKSANKLRPESRDRLLYGIELEVESRSSDREGAEWVRQFLHDDYCVFKHDGSLGSGGFEIVTRPDSMEVHAAKWQQLLESKPGSRLRSWDGGRCGMHVHVTKSALSQLQLGKMLCFLNDPANTSLVSAVAGRLPCSWCKVSPKKPSDVKLPQERYVALNITSKTAEFRIFRGTLLGSSFLKNLEFVEALVSYCAPAQRSIADSVSYVKFCQWVSKRDYPHLYAFLVQRGWVRRLAA